MNQTKIPIRCGTLVRLKIPFLENPAGSAAVIYETYNPFMNMISDSMDRGAPVVCIMMQNGGHQDIKPHVQELVFEVIGFDKFFALYAFKNIADLEEDFRYGYFDFAFEAGRRIISKMPEALIEQLQLATQNHGGGVYA